MLFTSGFIMYLSILEKSCTHPKNSCCTVWLPAGMGWGTEISYTDTGSAIWIHLTISCLNPSSISAVTLNSSMTSYHLTGLKEKTVYRVQISGFTKAGDGPPTLSHPFSTPKYGTVEALCMLPSISPCFMYYIWHYSLPFPAFQGVTKCSCTIYYSVLSYR